jgi:hypothetical protein
MLMIALLVALTACNGSTSDDTVAVERVEVPENACDLVPAELVADWDLADVDHSTSTRESLSFGRCTMSGAAPHGASLDLSLTNYSGGDADSADGFAAGERSDSCAELSATEASRGTFSETDSSCTARSTSAGTSVTTLISDVNESHGVVRIEMSAPAAEADGVESAVNDLLAAVKSSAAQG